MRRTRLSRDRLQSSKHRYLAQTRQALESSMMATTHLSYRRIEAVNTRRMHAFVTQIEARCFVDTQGAQADCDVALDSRMPLRQDSSITGSIEELEW